jgi:hypothetical protein
VVFAGPVARVPQGKESGNRFVLTVERRWRDGAERYNAMRCDTACAKRMDVKSSLLQLVIDISGSIGALSDSDCDSIFRCGVALSGPLAGHNMVRDQTQVSLQYSSSHARFAARPDVLSKDRARRIGEEIAQPIDQCMGTGLARGTAVKRDG